MTEKTDSIYASGLPSSISEAQLKEAFGSYGTVKWCKLVPKPKEGMMAALVQFGSVDEAAFLVENLSGSSLHEFMPDPVNMEFQKSKWAAGGGGDKGGGWGKGGGGKGGGGCPWGGKSFGFGGGDWGKGGKMGMMGMPMGEATINDLKKGLTQAGILPGGKWSDDDPCLYVSGLPNDTTDIDLYEIFGTFGAIPPRGIRAMRDKEDDSRCTGIGFVNFVTSEDAQKAIVALNGTTLRDGSALRVQIKGKRKPRPNPQQEAPPPQA